MGQLQTSVLYGGPLGAPTLDVGEADQNGLIGLVRAQHCGQPPQVTEICMPQTTKHG